VILLDTNICIHIVNARAASVLERFRQYRMGEIDICSVVEARMKSDSTTSSAPKRLAAINLPGLLAG